jgi:uncharacterized protein YaeQ
MALGSTLYRINVDVSNVDAGVYETLELRVAQHPSEDLVRLVTRVLAQILAHEDGLCVGRGLSEVDDPALYVKDATGNVVHWIDVGCPSAERLHRASKATPRVTIVSQKGAEGLIRVREKRPIHNVDKIAVWLLSPELVQSLAEQLERNNVWSLVRTGEELMVTVKDKLYSGSVLTTTLAALSLQ